MSCITYGKLSLCKQRYKANKSTHNPCPISPNITPNKKGKVTIVKIAGLTSLYLGTE